MKKKIILITIILINVILITFGTIKLYNYIKIKTANIKIELVDDLTMNFNDTKKVSDYIKSINGTIINDYEIETYNIGPKLIEFEFINNENIKLEYTFSIEVKDVTPPVIWLGNTYNIKKDSEDNIVDKVLCGDDFDPNPNCYIEGNYDLNTIGKYPLEFIAIDSSGNKSTQKFTLNVYDKLKSTSSTSNGETYTDFNKVKEKYKNQDTKIGIDVSAWQGTIDFEKIKNAGVEFIFIRVGGTLGIEGEYFLDQEFKRNIEEANKYNIPVGLYFYSYANSNEKARENAEWVLKQIKGYKIDLPIAFDWEEWDEFNDYNLSFFNLTDMAKGFINVVEKEGYKGMLYSSKAYLENMWFSIEHDIWLAHYIEETDYIGEYKVWQLCNNGKIDGIDGYVDINVMYNS